MSEAQQTEPENNEQQNITDLQKAYEATAQVYNCSIDSNKKSILTQTFGAATAIGATLISPQYILASLLLLNASFLKSVINKRSDLKNLAEKFKEETESLDNESHTYLKDISNELENVTPFSINDINPSQQRKDNKDGLAMAFAASFIPALLPMALGMMPHATDVKRNIRLKNMALEAKEALEKDHSLDVLVPKT